jgi:hypothetical protein
MSLVKSVGRALLPARARLALRDAYTRIEPYLYAGNRVSCPCCGSRYREFLPHRGRRNARCPHCDSLERHRLLYLFLRDRIRGGLSVLHFAPEGVLRRTLESEPGLRYTSVDLDSPHAAVHADITRLAFRDDCFDAVLCVHVLEHIPDDARALREILRVIRPGGWAVLQVPLERDRAVTYEDWSITDPARRLERFGQEDHVRVYGLDYKDRLARAGFQVRIENFARKLGPSAVLRHGLAEDEEIYLCEKPL